jgi:hypothetical protein
MTKLLKYARPEAKSVLENAIEALLVQLLADEHIVTNSMRVTIQGTEIQLGQTTIGDLAACGLADHWPEDYEFDSSGTPRDRRKKFVKLRKVWRNRRRRK